MPAAVPSPAPQRCRRAAVLAVVAGFAIALAACSSGSDTSAPATSAPPGTAPSGTAPSTATLAPDAAAMDAVVEEVAAELHVPGIVVLVRTPAGDYANRYGTVAIGSTEAPTFDTRVRVGSNTKTWTGTAILQMAQEGKLSVDDPVSRYRPDVPNGENITIGQLLDMRSGLYNYTATLELNVALDTEPERVWTPEELLALGFAHPPYFPPGEGWAYSNTNTVLLGLIAEQLDGKPLAQVFQDRFFTPLGMGGSSFPADTDTAIPAPSSRGYFFGTNVETMDDPALPADQQAAIDAGQVQPRDVTANNPSWTWAAGQGISTADDLATWVEAMVGGELLDAEVQARRMASVLPTTADPAAPGYGWGLAQMGPLFGHTGELPGFNSFMGHDPVNDVTVVIWANLAPAANGLPPATTLARALIPHIYATGADQTATVEEENPS